MTMELTSLSQRALEIRQLYSKFETSLYGRAWTPEEIALGFVGDVGDLAKLVLAQEGVRHIPDAQNKLAHELADCLWSVLVLAKVYNVDLEQAFIATMDELEAHIQSKIAPTR